jgi:K+-sensing histidine kinase KdpD
MFRLSRTYAWISLASVVLAAIVLSAVYRHFAVANLMTMGQRDTVALTHSFANSLGPQVLEWVNRAATLPIDAVRSNERTDALLELTKQNMRGTDVAKIKIYGLNGRTVFSTERKQIGEDKSGNAGFAAARAGKVATELTHRDKFSAFDQVIENRNLLSAYIPIRNKESAQVEVVFELYSDVTELMQDINRTQTWVTGAVVAVMLLLYGGLFLVVRFADRLIRNQYDQLRAASNELSMARDDLEQRVRERTAQLEQTNAGLTTAWNAADRANQLRAEFLSGISHAIREPMSGLLGASQRLAGTGLDAAQRRYVDHVQSCADAMRLVIDQIVDRSQPSSEAREGDSRQAKSRAAAPVAAG